MEFSFEIAHCGKSLIAILRDIFANINKTCILTRGPELAYLSMKFKDFSDVS